MSDDWHDPFAEDEDAPRERERRRAEREAKRKGRKESTRQSLGDRVREQLSGGPSEASDVPVTPASRGTQARRTGRRGDAQARGAEARGSGQGPDPGADRAGAARGLDTADG